MNCTYYINFEQKYKKHQWWIDKKARIDQTIKDFDSKDPILKARAVAQTKVRILKRFVQVKFVQIEISFQLNRDLVEAVGNANKYGGVGRNPDPEKVRKLLDEGAQPDFVMPWLPDNKRQR